MSARKDRISRTVRNRANATAGVTDVAKDPKAPRDLGDPATQKAILFPETYPIAIDLDGQQVKATIKLRFSFGDVIDRRVLEDIESFGRLFSGELTNVGFDNAQPFQEQGYKVDAVAMRSHIRDAARDVLVKITTFDEPVVKMVDGVRHEKTRPTREDLAVGLSGNMMSALAMLLVRIRSEEVERRKNSQPAIPASG